MTASLDIDRDCRDCGRRFSIDVTEQSWYATKGFSLPVRCKPCRQARRAQRDRQLDEQAQRTGA